MKPASSATRWCCRCPATSRQAVLDEILKQHNLTTIASQCLQEGGNAAFRMRHASSQTVAAVIRALAAHQIIAAAQANYVYTTAGDVGAVGDVATGRSRPIRAGEAAPAGGASHGHGQRHPDRGDRLRDRRRASRSHRAPSPTATTRPASRTARMRTAPAWPARSCRTRSCSASRPARASSRSAPSPPAPRATESTTYHILRGIDHAVANNVRIINMSFAGPRDPVDRARAQGGLRQGRGPDRRGRQCRAARAGALPGGRPERDRGHRHRHRRPAVHRRQPRQPRRDRRAGRGHPGAGAVRRIPGHDRNFGRDRAYQRRGGADAGAQRQAHAAPTSAGSSSPARSGSGRRTSSAPGWSIRCRAIEMATPRSAAAPAMPRPGDGHGDDAADNDGGGATVVRSPLPAEPSAVAP